jgi:hypothetical protein
MTIDDTELDARLAALARDTEPDERNWRRIERRIRPRQRAPIAAAAAVAVVAIAVGIVAQFRGGGDVPRDHQLLEAEVKAMAAAAPDEAALRRAGSPEALMQAWQHNRQAIEELERALVRDPDNTLLLEFLSEARLRQARLVQQGMTTTERSMTL